MELLMPREKLSLHGAKSLSDHELLAIFLRTGIKGCNVLQLSELVLKEFGSLRGLLSADEKQFCAIKGLGKTQFIQLNAVMEMAKRYLLENLMFQPTFTDPESVRLFLQAELSAEEREVFLVLFLDNQHKLIKKDQLFSGTINTAAVYPREIIKAALYCNSSALILAHNHPSGEILPSDSDKMITRKIVEAAELMEMRILDHFIVGKNRCFSFAENDLI